MSEPDAFLIGERLAAAIDQAIADLIRTCDGPELNPRLNHLARLLAQAAHSLRQYTGAAPR